MDRFLAGADADRRQRSIELTRDMTKLRSRLHDLRKQAVSLGSLNPVAPKCWVHLMMEGCLGVLVDHPEPAVVVMAPLRAQSPSPPLDDHC
jgi:hypothetical protein